jgi:hypothetical protein
MAKKGGIMRYLKFAAMGVLAMSLSSFAALGQMRAGVGYQGATLDSPDYRPGIGLNGHVASEAPFLGAAASAGLGLRADYQHYRLEGNDQIDEANLNQGGIHLTGMIGPNALFFQPRVGGHLGYTRLEDRNFAEFGPDVSASFKFTPQLGIHALVTPTWLANEDDTDFHGTKMGLGVTWSTPGA